MMTTKETFTQSLRKEVHDIWEANFEHPFVKGIAKGDLPIECFRFYVLQDSYYLSHFARVQAIAASKAENLYMTSRMASHAQGTYEAELGLHNKFMEVLKVSEEELNQFRPAPTAYAYTSHLYRVAETGTVGEVIASLLPCYWIYYDIGQSFKGAKPKEEIYRTWIDTYGGEWFVKLVLEQIHHLDRLAEIASETEKEKMKMAFTISCQYELAFWEMAYTQEKWLSDKTYA